MSFIEEIKKRIEIGIADIKNKNSILLKDFEEEIKIRKALADELSDCSIYLSHCQRELLEYCEGVEREILYFKDYMNGDRDD